MSGIVRAVHQSSSKLRDTPLVRLDLFESLPSRRFGVEPLQQTLQQNRALHRSTTQALRPAADVELYSSTALQSALHLYSSTALYTLHPLHPPSAQARAGSRTETSPPTFAGFCKSDKTIGIANLLKISLNTQKRGRGARGRGRGAERVGQRAKGISLTYIDRERCTWHVLLKSVEF